jgi:hypothetical protein
MVLMAAQHARMCRDKKNPIRLQRRIGMPSARVGSSTDKLYGMDDAKELLEMGCVHITIMAGLAYWTSTGSAERLRLRWLWFEWSSPDRPWKGTPLPIDSTDMALFNAATKVEVHNGCKASFWNSSWLDGKAP